MTIIRNIFGFLIFILFLAAVYGNAGKRDQQGQINAEEHARKLAIHLSAIHSGNERVEMAGRWREIQYAELKSKWAGRGKK